MFEGCVAWRGRVHSEEPWIRAEAKPVPEPAQATLLVNEKNEHIKAPEGKQNRWSGCHNLHISASRLYPS